MARRKAKAELTKMTMKAGLPPRSRKQYRGEQYFFRGTYQEEALEQWKAKKAEIDAKPLVKLPPEVDEQAQLAWALRHGDHKLADTIRHNLESGFGPPLPSESVTAVWKERFRLETTEAEAQTIKATIDAFLDGKRTKADAGQISLGRWQFLGDTLAHFRRSAGDANPITAINEKCLSTFYNTLLGRMTEGKMSATYAASVFSIARQFIRWAYREGWLKIPPRNLDAQDFTFDAKDGIEIKTFKRSEITAILDGATDRKKLYIMLGLNCGFYAKDIAALTHTQINLQKGLIRRKRSKTEKSKRVPTVTYPLWPMTLELLKKFSSEHPTLVLVNEDGGPLWHEHVNDDGKRVHVDNIKVAWYRLKVRLKDQGITVAKPFKCLRKTSASALDKHRQYGRYAPYFLGHAPRDMSRKHYTKPSRIQFRSAVEWLGRKLGFVPTTCRLRDDGQAKADVVPPVTGG